MKYVLPRVFDGILSKLVFFGLGAIIAAYFLRSVTDILLFAALFSLCVSEAYLHFIGKRDNAGDRKRQRAVREKFVYADDRFALDYFIKALSARREVKRRYRFADVNGVALFCRIKPAPLAADALVDMLAYAAKRGYARAVVLTDTYSPAAASAAAAFPGVETRLVDFDGVMRLLVALDAVPEISEKRTRRGVKAFFAAALSRERANAYLVCSLILAAFSGFTLFSVYYLVAAAILFVMSVALRFVKRKN